MVLRNGMADNLKFTSDNIKASESLMEWARLLITDKWRDSIFHCCPLYCNSSQSFLPTKNKPTSQYKQRHGHMLLSNEDQLCMYAAGGATKHYSESIQPVGRAAAPAPPRWSKAESTKLFFFFLLLRRLFLHLVHPGSTGATRLDCTGLQNPSRLSGFSCSVWFQP